MKEQHLSNEIFSELVKNGRKESEENKRDEREWENEEGW